MLEEEVSKVLSKMNRSILTIPASSIFIFFLVFWFTPGNVQSLVPRQAETSPFKGNSGDPPDVSLDLSSVEN